MVSAGRRRNGGVLSPNSGRQRPGTGTTILIRNNQRRRRGGGNSGPRPQQMAGGNNYGNRLDNRQRGNATQLLEKYRALARDAQQAGDRVTAEYYLQYAEHYFRVLGDYRDRQPDGRGDGRRGRDGEDEELTEGEDADMEAAETGEADENEPRRARPERQRDERQRDERQRGDRQRDDRQRDDRQRDDRQREERGGDERGRRDWQRDRRDRRSDTPRGDTGLDADSAAGEAADDREQLLQALPPAVARSGEGGRRLSLKRDAAMPGSGAESGDAPVAAEVGDLAVQPDSAPRRRTRARKPVAEPAEE